MTYPQAVGIIRRFVIQIGDDLCVHLSNVKPLLGKSAFERMVLHGETVFPRPGFVTPDDACVWLCIADAESSCEGRG
jgi:hypothetical protein